MRKKLKLFGLAMLLFAASMFGVAGQQFAQATSVDKSRDYDKYAIVYGGTMSVAEVREKYNQKDHAAVFKAFGISKSDLKGDIKKGVVHQNGKVTVGNKTVATGAKMGARYLGGTAIKGSDTAKKVSVSKMASDQEALVKFNSDGEFEWAIMTPCGNPVVATPKAEPKPEPKPEPTPEPEPEMCPIKGKEQYEKDDAECKVDKPSIEITKTVNDAKHAEVAVGEEFSYQIEVKNTGDVALKDAEVTDKAPSQVTLVSASEGKITGNTWADTISELAVGETKSYTLTAKYAKYAGGTHKNTVCVDTPDIKGNSDDCDYATTKTTEQITVCDTDTNEVVTIDRSELDASHMTIDQTKCEDEPEPTPEEPEEPEEEEPTPKELPKTGGVNGGVFSLIGTGGLVAATGAYLASRRSI